MIQPIKSLGQNFLRDDNVLRNIIKHLQLERDDVVIEIGPGQGALTKYLCDNPIKLIVIEVDKRAIQLLKDRFADRLIIIHGDILNVELKKIAEQHSRRLRIVGNIPYYLTSEILFYLFDSHSVILDASLMVQLEVAHRLTAQPKSKEYGILTVFTQFFSDCKLLFEVSRNSFFPKPEVDSAMIRIRFKEQLPNVSVELFRSIVRTTFGTRRKTLRNGLKSLKLKDEALNKLAFDLNKRPEELSVEEFILLTNNLFEVMNRK